MYLYIYIIHWSVGNEHAEMLHWEYDMIQIFWDGVVG